MCEDAGMAVRAPALSLVLATLVVSSACGLTAFPEPRPPREASEQAPPPLVFSPERPPDVVINELMAKNDSTIQDDPGEYPDWVELLNRSDAPVDGARIELTLPGGRVWSAAGWVLAPGALIVVFFD